MAAAAAHGSAPWQQGAAPPALLQRPRLVYWAIPGRAEVTRLLLHLAHVDFEDCRIGFEEWPALCGAAPFGQVPTLQLPGSAEVFGQSFALVQWAARLAGLLPADPLAAALADQACSLVEEAMKAAAHTHLIHDAAAAAAARAALLQPGQLFLLKLQQLEALVAARPGRYIAGEQLSHGDLQLFNFVATLRSGLWAGLPSNLLDSFPALRAFRHAIASEPAIAAFYAAATDDVRRAGYTPDAAAA